MRLIIAMSGASGVIYGVRLLELAHGLPELETHLVMTSAARVNLAIETGWTPKDVERLATHVHNVRDLAASISSGLFRTERMIVAPCSIKTLSSIANCYSDKGLPLYAIWSTIRRLRWADPRPEGLVKYEPGRGITVSKLPDDIADIYTVRGVLEGLAARLAAARRTSQELEALRSLVKQMAQAYRSQDYKTAVRLHSQFNMLIYQSARSRRLHDLGARLQEYTERSQLRSLSVPGRCRAIQQEHQRIVAALEGGDAKGAEKAVRLHVEHARDAYLKSLDTWGA